MSDKEQSRQRRQGIDEGQRASKGGRDPGEPRPNFVSTKPSGATTTPAQTSQPSQSTQSTTKDGAGD